MILAEFFTALAIGILVVFFFSLVLGRRGPWVRGEAWSGVLWFFLVVFLGAWAIGAWVDPVGPAFYGVAWVPFFFGALVFALLLAALSEPRPRTVTTTGTEAGAEAALGLFFWVLILALFVAVIFGSI